MASVLQTIVLLTFIRTGRTAQEGIQDETEVKQRRKGELLSQRNNDGVSEHLFTYQELAFVLQASQGWLEAMRELVVQWSEEMIRLCRNTELKNKLSL